MPVMAMSTFWHGTAHIPQRRDRGLHRDRASRLALAATLGPEFRSSAPILGSDGVKSLVSALHTGHDCDIA
jgi:hypothetical protein